MGWDQLRVIIDENKEVNANAKREPPVACPIDGSILDVRADGVRNCRMGNFRWPR